METAIHSQKTIGGEVGSSSLGVQAAGGTQSFNQVSAQRDVGAIWALVVAKGFQLHAANFIWMKA